jgi:AcrR family transcriptional regulator
MDEKVKRQAAPRHYDASGRRAAAARTRRAIVDAARALFIERGYEATTIAAIAPATGVSHETVYAAFGPKPALFRHLVELALSGTGEEIPALQRPIVSQVRAEPDARRALALFAHEVALLQGRVAPLFAALSVAAQTDADLRVFAGELSARRVGHMRAFILGLMEKTTLREGVTIEAATDTIWIMNSPEFYLLCARDRGWTPEYFERWLAETWALLLLPAATPE